jgi:uncharacterized protein YajQ (UPF0234 family)
MMEEKVKDIVSFISAKEKEVEIEVEKAKKELEEEYYWKVQEYSIKMEEEKKRFLNDLRGEEESCRKALKLKLEKMEQEYIDEINKYRKDVENRISYIVDFLLSKLIQR